MTNDLCPLWVVCSTLILTYLDPLIGLATNH